MAARYAYRASPLDTLHRLLKGTLSCLFSPVYRFLGVNNDRLFPIQTQELEGFWIIAHP